MYDYGTNFHFPKDLFENPFWRLPKYSKFEFGNLIYSSKRNPNVSYASKRERANIAFNIKVKLDTAKKEDPLFVVPPGGTKLWPRNDFF